MVTSAPPPTSPPASSDPQARITEIAHQLRSLREIDWVGVPGNGAGEALIALEAVSRAFTALQSELINAAEASGMWALDGHRTFTTWLSNTTGTTRATTNRAVRLSTSLRDFLPRTREALAEGVITRDHAEILSRKCTRTEKHRSLLLDSELGEEFLVESAKELDATQFRKVAEQWAVMSDPEAADRGWRAANAKEEVFLSPTMDGYLLSGWLSEANGLILEEALNSHMGRKAADDLRSVKERRADALVSLARYSLDSGAKLASARIRPHLTVTMGLETLTALADAARPAFDSPPLFPEWALKSAPALTALPFGPDCNAAEVSQWMATWVPGADHVMNVGLDYERLKGVEPATFPDGTPLAPTLLSQLTCESMIARVVFGPDSTVLDSGREERLFSASQTRAIIARDKHCQYPGCDAPPGFGEIHHSQEWLKHNGSTHVDLGILLCWWHHSLVHERGITIFRISGKWLFMRRTGQAIEPADHTNLWPPPDPDPPPS